SLHNVAAKSRVRTHWPFEIHSRTCLQPVQAGAIQRLTRHLGGKRPVGDGASRQAYAIHRYARADLQVVENRSSANLNRPEVSRIADSDNLADFFNDACEHMPLS